MVNPGKKASKGPPKSNPTPPPSSQAPPSQEPSAQEPPSNDPSPGFVLAGRRRNRMQSQSPIRKDPISSRKDSIPTIQQRRESLSGQQRKSSTERPPSRKNSLTSNPFFNLFQKESGDGAAAAPTGPAKSEAPSKAPEVPQIIPEVPAPAEPTKVAEKTPDTQPTGSAKPRKNSLTSPFLNLFQKDDSAANKRPVSPNPRMTPPPSGPAKNEAPKLDVPEKIPEKNPEVQPTGAAKPRKNSLTSPFLNLFQKDDGASNKRSVSPNPRMTPPPSGPKNEIPKLDVPEKIPEKNPEVQPTGPAKPRKNSLTSPFLNLFQKDDGASNKRSVSPNPRMTPPPIGPAKNEASAKPEIPKIIPEVPPGGPAKPRKNSLTSSPFFNLFQKESDRDGATNKPSVSSRMTPPPTVPGKLEGPAKMADVPEKIPEVPSPAVSAKMQEEPAPAKKPDPLMTRKPALKKARSLSKLPEMLGKKEPEIKKPAEAPAKIPEEAPKQIHKMASKKLPEEEPTKLDEQTQKLPEEAPPKKPEPAPRKPALVVRKKDADANKTETSTPKEETPTATVLKSPSTNMSDTPLKKPDLPAKKQEAQPNTPEEPAKKPELPSKKASKKHEKQAKEAKELEAPTKMPETPTEKPDLPSKKKFLGKKHSQEKLSEKQTKEPESHTQMPDLLAKKPQPESPSKMPDSPTSPQPETTAPKKPDLPTKRPSLQSKRHRTQISPLAAPSDTQPTLSSASSPTTPKTPITPNTLDVPKGSPMFPRIDIIDKTPGSPRMSSKSKKKHRQRLHRHTSNVFSMFNQDQIQEFKEAFNMIDQNRDGFIDRDDLLEIYTSLGKNPTDDLMELMLREAPGPINFTMFLTLFGEKLNGTDPEDVIRNAFACFDMIGGGELGEDYLREIMTTMGDRWTHDMVDELLFGVPIKQGKFDYIEFTRVLKHGGKDENEKNEGMQQPQPPIPPMPR